MPDDTTAAIQALIQQVTALTETVQTQQKHISALKADILDEKKDALREKDTALSSVDKILAQLETQQREKALRLAGFERDASGNLILGSRAAEGAVYLTREEARDPVKYREAKAKAEASGLPMRVTDTRDDPTRRNTGQPDIMKSTVFTFDDSHERIRYVRADMQTGAGIVHRRLAAEREGYTVKTFRTLDDLPGPMRDKFRRMELAANAGGDSAETET